MKTTITGSVIQALLLFVFLFNPTELNIGATIVTLPPWALSISTILGNVTWLWGLLVLFVAIIYTFATIHNNGELLTQLVDAAITANIYTNKFMSDVLLTTSCIIAVIGLGSGFWFVGLTTLLANLSLMEYRKRYWQCKKRGVFDDMEAATKASESETEFNDLFDDVIEGEFKNLKDD